jgi:NAD(P)-dependent dehydrogenase (short-subunit alcohol dehydrogenase family)
MMFDLTGRTAVVTGAGQNVGAGIARTLAGQGASVIVNDIVKERADDTVAQISAAGGTASSAAFDVTDYDAVMAAFADIGAVDILVNNAGNGGAEGMGLVQFRDSEPAGWRGAINVNLFGVLHCSRAVINGMCERNFGRVITISSGAGLTGLRIGVSPYAAGKGGAIAFMRHLAAETARFGVTANSVALGMMQAGTEDATAALVRQIPVGRTGTPEDVGAVCVYLASDEGSWMTGQTLHLDGGSTFS